MDTEKILISLKIFMNNNPFRKYDNIQNAFDKIKNKFNLKFKNREEEHVFRSKLNEMLNSKTYFRLLVVMIEVDICFLSKHNNKNE